MPEINRVLMSADTVGGVWTYAVELCRGLGERDVQVVLATMGAPLRTDQRRALAGLRNVVLEESGFALEWMEDPWDDVDRAGDWLLELEQRHHPDVVHLNGYAHAALPWTVPALVVGHSCVLSWWRAVKGEDAPESWDSYRQRVRTGIRAADMVLAPTSWMLNQLQQFYGPLAHWRIVPNARTLPRSHRSAKEPMILSLGRLWDEAKGVLTLAEAAKGLPWPVFVAGDARGPDGTSVEPPNVRFLGYQYADEAVRLCRRASIYALPAHYEPFGLSALEAAQCGCALVLGDIPSLREVWGDSAVFVAPGDSWELHRALKSLIDDPSLQRHYADAARMRAERFTNERMTRSYLDTYACLCGGTRAGGPSLPETATLLS
ncbi:glycosyl transferase family 1 [Opitutaceae bacterium EW11]|nr:glycosyl transferase family 1 [Opitutaceae bacterium EW11]